MTKLSKISIIIFVLTFFTQIVVSNHMAVKTNEFNELQGQLIEIQNQISAHNQEIYTLSSITGMEEKALKNGFLKMDRSVNNIGNPTIARSH